MRSRMQSKIGNREAGAFNVLAVAFVLPIVILIVLFAADWYRVVRSYMVVTYVAERAAKIASAPIGASGISLKNQDLPQWIAQDPTALDQCRAAGTAAENCYNNSGGRMAALTFPGASSDDFTGIGSGLVQNLPFSLFEWPHDTLGYFPVQALPLVGIEHGCFETFNETAATITFGLRTYLSDPDDSAKCRHVKPMYWQSPVKADFDGDRKADLVFFKPMGDSDDYGPVTDIGESDFIVYLSSYGYSAAGGLGYFNLATARAAESSNPHTIPVVADYDRDGMADYAVFEPATGYYRIAFSSRNYRVIMQGVVDSDYVDELSEKGILAIPGNYRSSTKTDIAVVRTGGSDVSKRYNLYVTDLYDDMVSILDGKGFPGTVDIEPGFTNGDVYSSAALKPHRGYVAVPAFADYDDDGITEIGYLSYAGGNLAKRVLGKVPDINTTQSAVSARFSTTLSVSADNFKINPFDTVFDTDGNLLVLDSVDSRLWMVDAPDVHGSFSSGNAVPIMPSFVNLSSAATRWGGWDETLFPENNVLNVPKENAVNTIGASDTDVGAGHQDKVASSRALNKPRKMVYAPDGALYIADYGNSRIIRVEPEDGSITSTTKAIVVLGSTTCAFPPAVALPGTTCPDHALASEVPSDPSLSLSWETRSGRWFFYPLAIEVVPDPSDASKYRIAFSAGKDLYLITPTGAHAGPVGTAGEKIYRIAGNGAAPPEPDGPTLATGTASVYGSGFDASDSFCPISDIKYNEFSGERFLFLASSCSLNTSPTTDPYPTFSGIDDAANFGAILRLMATDASGEFHSTLGELDILAGQAWMTPCHSSSAKCSGPTEEGAPGIYQRKINLTSSNLPELDIINPVDLAWGPNNNLLFINQWNAVGEENGGAYTKYSYSPSRSDEQHQQGVYMITLDSVGDAQQIEALTNPFQFGSDTIPVENANWRSPYSDSSRALQNYVPAFEAPAKNQPVPAVSSLLVNSDRTMLFAATPFLQNVHDNSHPYYVDASQVGFIYRIDLDLDGDSISDSSDTDIDGDGRTNTDPDEYCPEAYLADGSAYACRMQEKIGNPIQYFFKLTGAGVHLQNPDSSLDKGVGEYFIMNSVSECGSKSTCGDVGDTYVGKLARPEPLALLLNFGDDLDYDWVVDADKTCVASPADPYVAGDPAYNCAVTANGPIAAPVAQSGFSGDGTPFSAFDSRIGKGFGFEIATNPDSTRSSGSSSLLTEYSFMYPLILSSTMPRENGIKPTRATKLTGDTSKTPGVDSAGVVCGSYMKSVYGAGGDPATAADQSHDFFTFQMDSDSGLTTYLSSGLSELDDASFTMDSPDNDNLNYNASCGVGAVAYEDSSGNEVMSEGVVLQLDHDDTEAKEVDTNTADAHFPSRFVATLPGGTENRRQFLMIDSDGDGIGNPSWLTTDSFSEYDSEADASARDFPNLGPYTFISTGLKVPTWDNARSIREMIDAFRYPFNSVGGQESEQPDLLKNLGVANFNISSGILKSTFFGKKAAGEDYDNLSFDKNRDLTEGREAIFVGLDFEPYIQKGIGANFGITNVGGGMYANFAETNRWDSDGPPIIAAKNLLSVILGVDKSEVTTTKADFDSKTKDIFVRWVKRSSGGDEEDCSPYTGTIDERCTRIRISRRVNFYWTEIIVDGEAALNGDVIQSCDASASGDFPCPTPD